MVLSRSLTGALGATVRALIASVALLVIAPGLAAAQSVVASPNESPDRAQPQAAQGAGNAAPAAPAPSAAGQATASSQTSSQPGSLSGAPANQQAAGAAATRRDPSLGFLRIVVYDESGAAILGSQVTIANTTGVDRAQTTNERGETVFENLPPGKYIIHAESAGFDAFDVPDVTIKRGQNNRELTLKIAGYVEQVDVTRDKTDERIADTQSTALSAEEIDQLPDDPDEMQSVLEQMAGPGASMFVNGFNGGRLPSKSQIQSIRMRFDPFSADNHDAGRPRIDIQTRPGAGEWRNNMTFTFRDESLNGRYFFADERAPEQSRRGFWTVEGPLVKGKTSFALSVMGFDAYDSQTITARNVDGTRLGDASQQPARRLNVDARVEHAINKNHTLRVTFERNSNRQRNLGVGDISLAETGYSRDTTDNEFRISESGLWGKYRNEIRFQYEETTIDSASLSNALTLLVPGDRREGGGQMSGGTLAREVQVSDDLDFAIGKKHSLRFGMRMNGGNYRNDLIQNAVGTYTFTTLEDFAIRNAAQFTQRIVNNPLVAYTNVETALYAMDDYKLRKNIVLGVGLRYEAQSILNDWNNLAPRVSLTWSPSRSARTTVRAGFGIFYDWYDATSYAQTVQLDGLHQSDLIIIDPSYPDPSAGGGSSLVIPPSLVVNAPNLDMPTVRRASLGVDHQLNAWLRLRTNVFTQHGWNELRALNANYPVDGLRPDSTHGNISQIQSIGESDSYGVDLGLNITVPQRRIFAFVNYTLATQKNDGGLTLSPTNTLATEWGYASNDIRHRLFTMFSTPLPKNFRAQTMVRFQSGPRYNVTLGQDLNQDGVINERPDGIARNAGRGDGQFVMDLRLGWTVGFGPAKTPAGPGGRGRGGRGGGGQGGGPNIVRMPGGGGPGGGPGGGGMMGGGGNDTNKRYSMEIFAQANNVLNHPTFMSYGGVFGSDNFGIPTAAQPPRRIEFGTRFGF